MAHKSDPKLKLVAAPPASPSGELDEPASLDTGTSNGFSPFRFQAHVVQPEDRVKWMRAELPSIDPKILQDTLPPTAVPPTAMMTGVHGTSDAVIDPNATTMLYSIGDLAAPEEVGPQIPDDADLQVAEPPKKRARRKGIWLLAFLLPLLGLLLRAVIDHVVVPNPAPEPAEVAPKPITPTAVQAPRLPPVVSAAPLESSAVVSEKVTGVVSAARAPERPTKLRVGPRIPIAENTAHAVPSEVSSKPAVTSPPVEPGPSHRLFTTAPVHPAE